MGDRAEGHAQRDAFAIDEVEGDGCEINKYIAISNSSLCIDV